MCKKERDFVLTPLSIEELSKIFDPVAINVLSFFLRKSFIAQPEVLKKQTAISFQVPKEHVEQWVVQSIGGTPVGAGSFPVDVVFENSYAVDVKTLKCKLKKDKTFKNTNSNESSLSQKFKGTGENLDKLFEDEKYLEILDGWNAIYKRKYREVRKQYRLKNIYYIFVLTTEHDFYLCGVRVNVNRISRTDVNISKSTKKSLVVKNFIDDEYGNVKIYKSKKRMELRLRPKKWFDDKLLVKLDVNYNPVIRNIRNVVENGLVKNHIDNLVKEVFDDGD